MGASLTRRELLKAAGLTSAVVAASGLGGIAKPAAATESPEVFLAWAYAQRARAGAAGDAGLLDAIYDIANPDLARFESERAKYIGGGGHFRAPIRRVGSTISIESLDTDGAEAKARLRETFEAFTVPLTAVIRLESGDVPVPREPGGEIRSAATIHHEVLLSRNASGWRIARDEHDECWLYGRSPDLRPGGWAAEIYGRNRNVGLGRPSQTESLPAGATDRRGLARALALVQFQRLAAYQYGQQYATWPGYAPPYCNYHTCDGDCANFMSQTLRQGGHTDVGQFPSTSAWATSWPPSDGHCGKCTNRATYAATDLWANAHNCPNWLLSSGRASLFTSVGALLSADVIQYNWDGGWFDHTAMVSYFQDGTARVVCHTPYLLNQPWTIAPTTDVRFVHIREYF